MITISDDAQAELRWGDEARMPDALIGRPPAGLAVTCTDAYAGRVLSTTLDRAGRLCTVTVRLRGLWGRQVDAPASWIEGRDQATLRLRVERQRLLDLPSRRSAADISSDARHALRAEGILRGSNFDDVSVALCGDAATLSGHVRSATDRLNAVRALGQVSGVREVQNDLVADDDLVNLVAQALAHDERTRHETVFVAVSQGIVILSGLRNSLTARAAAEECAGWVPSVRGVSNYIEAPGAVVTAAHERVLQPRIGQEVFARDMCLGRVERVIIDPRNRRVVAVLVSGQFPVWQPSNTTWHEAQLEERRLQVSTADIDFVTPTVVQLSINGAAAAAHDNFSLEDFAQPDPAWRPPYPFAAAECLWARS